MYNIGTELRIVKEVGNVVAMCSVILLAHVLVLQAFLFSLNEIGKLLARLSKILIIFFANFLARDLIFWLPMFFGAI
jgi:putative flippase GtrA